MNWLFLLKEMKYKGEGFTSGLYVSLKCYLNKMTVEINIIILDC